MRATSPIFITREEFLVVSVNPRNAAEMLSTLDWMT